MKAPAFQFYVKDFISSTKVSLMSPDQVGAYILLLCHCWMDDDCSIPDDDILLSKLTRMGEGWLKGGSTLVRQCFVPHPNQSGKLINLRLLEERAKQDEWREKSAAGGRKSGESRKKWRESGLARLSTQENGSKGGSTTLQPPYEPNGNTTSTSTTNNIYSSNGDAIGANELGNELENEFEYFWNTYDKKIGRKKCKAVWDKLSQPVKNKVAEKLPAYILKTADKKFRKDPLTWLNGAHWEDELETTGNSEIKMVM